MSAEVAAPPHASVNGAGAMPSVSPLQLARIAMDVFAERTMRLLTMLLAFVLCGACVLMPHWVALAAAVLYTVLVAPIWWRRPEASHGS